MQGQGQPQLPHTLFPKIDRENIVLDGENFPVSKGFVTDKTSGAKLRQDMVGGSFFQRGVVDDRRGRPLRLHGVFHLFASARQHLVDGQQLTVTVREGDQLPVKTFRDDFSFAQRRIEKLRVFVISETKQEASPHWNRYSSFLALVMPT